MTKPIETDEFGRTLSKLFDNLKGRTEDELSESIKNGLRTGAKKWRENAIEEGWGTKGSGGHKYRKHARTYETGQYVKSIRHHVVIKDGEKPWGEIGVPKMAGLPHLLEFGHASPGGGRVKGHVHIAPAAEATFESTTNGIEDDIDKVLEGL